ncbi:prostaglandin E synthase [Latimeria chalumnae]|uniref:Prostaglandin E synthase n=1 Tax=Latimeria chalumnae TaxID=7897 RepID=H3AER5_LATCH|nr:PREDICTED: prostaglandin E synthase [Latimeria chalumnae]|eukprot:XP_005993300.1 PREDICTED: prostaglandin E synthase [Latimeria chalumnae]
MLKNAVFASFVLYSTLLVAKMYIIAIITGQLRLRRKAFANPEDAMRHGGLEYFREDSDVERSRRVHRNDMETIFPFLFLGAIYCMSNPNPFLAQMHFRIFFLGRMVHSVAYLLALKAPTRSLAYAVAQLPCFSMAIQLIYTVASYW